MAEDFDPDAYLASKAKEAQAMPMAEAPHSLEAKPQEEKKDTKLKSVLNSMLYDLITNKPTNPNAVEPLNAMQIMAPGVGSFAKAIPGALGFGRASEGVEAAAAAKSGGAVARRVENAVERIDPFTKKAVLSGDKVQAETSSKLDPFTKKPMEGPAEEATQAPEEKGDGESSIGRRLAGELLKLGILGTAGKVGYHLLKKVIK